MEQNLQLTALDGYPLNATLYEAAPDTDVRHAAVLCSGGTIQARAYRRFGLWLAARGVPLLTYDNRGIGGSRPARLRGFDAGFEDWADFDCPAAITWLRKRYPHAELIGISHCIGGLVLPCARHTDLLSRYLFIASHTGYYGDYHRRWRWLMTPALHVLMPALTRLFGYFPGRAFGMGADAPARFTYQWARRRTPHFQADTARYAAALERGCDARGRALALTFADDAFVTERGTRRLLDYMPGIDAELRVIEPREVGLRDIGHFGFFRTSAERALWQTAADWIQQ